MNYLTNYVNMNRSMLESLLTCMEKETYLIKTIHESNLEGFSILEEGWRESIKEFFATIVKFFKETFNMFASKVKALQHRYSEWSVLNRIKFKTIDYSKLSRRMVPYWKGDATFTKLIDGLNKVNADILENINKSKTETKETQKNDYLDLTLNTMRINDVADIEGGKITEALKNHFRTGTSEILEPVTITGDELKSAVNTALKYCDTYSSGISRRLITEQNKVISTLHKVENMFNTQNANLEQMFCLIEDITYANSYTSDNIIFEETKLVNTPDKPKVSPTKVETLNKDETKPATDKVAPTDKDKTKPVEKETGNSTAMLTRVKEAFNSQKLMLSIAITIAEEKFTAYNNLLISVSNIKPPKATNEKK